jgi:phage terminase large subunit-like protein
MAGVNWIYKYYQGIKDGTYTVGKWVELLYEYIVGALGRKELFFDQKKAKAAIEWIEQHCFHTEGPLAPQSIKLEVWQKAFYSAMYGITDANGQRQFREVVLVIARKNGKTKMASSAAAYNWRQDGGFGARVFCIAPKLEQAGLVYDDIWTMTQLDPEWQQLKDELSERDQHNKKVNDDSMLARHRQSDLAIPGTNSTVKKIAFNAKKSDGFNPSLCICDEVASWVGDPGLKQYEVMKSGMGARPDGQLLSCTTAGYVNDGIYDELIKRSTRFLLGESKEKRLLPVLYMIDDLDKWNDINEIRKANPNLGVSVSVDYMLEEIAIAEGSLSKKSEFLTKYCCVKQNSSQAWLNAQDVAKCVGPHLELEDFRHNYCVGGIDLSRTTDLTAACIVIQKQGELYVFCQFFLPREKIDEAQARDGVPYRAFIQRGILKESGDNFVDYNDCLEWFQTLVRKYELLPLVVGYDRYNAQYLTKEMEQQGFRLSDVFQGENLSPVIDELEGLIKDGKVHIGDNDLLKIHLLDSAVKQNAETLRKRLIKVSPAVHIDGCAALLDAMTVRQHDWNELGPRLINDR